MGEINVRSNGGYLLAVLASDMAFLLSGSDRAATHGSPRQVYGNERDGPASTE